MQASCVFVSGAKPTLGIQSAESVILTQTPTPTLYTATTLGGTPHILQATQLNRLPNFKQPAHRRYNADMRRSTVRDGASCRALPCSHLIVAHAVFFLVLTAMWNASPRVRPADRMTLHKDIAIEARVALGSAFQTSPGSSPGSSLQQGHERCLNMPLTDRRIRPHSIRMYYHGCPIRDPDLSACECRPGGFFAVNRHICMCVDV